MTFEEVIQHLENNGNASTLKAANTINLVEVDYDYTSCKTIHTKAALKKAKV
jgi:hypothetical protein